VEGAGIYNRIDFITFPWHIEVPLEITYSIASCLPHSLFLKQPSSRNIEGSHHKNTDQCLSVLILTYP